MSISAELKETNPLASCFSFSSIINTFSPLSNDPFIFVIPAANKLFPFKSAFAAPLSICITPDELRDPIIHFFLASKLEILGIKWV